MNNLVYIDLSETERLIKPVLEKYPEIVGAHFLIHPWVVAELTMILMLGLS